MVEGVMREFLLYVWQLPQNLLGLILVWILKPESKVPYKGAVVHLVPRRLIGVSLGRYIILRKNRKLDVAHEWGHCRQSMRLGWLYLLVVGVVSGLRSWLNIYKKGKYYDHWIERWADKLGGVWQDEYGIRRAPEEEEEQP
jgi:hypothetical protein